MLNVLFQLLHTSCQQTYIHCSYQDWMDVKYFFVTHKVLQVAKYDIHVHKSSAMLPVFIEHLNWSTAGWSCVFNGMTKLN